MGNSCVDGGKDEGGRGNSCLNEERKGKKERGTERRRKKGGEK